MANIYSYPQISELATNDTIAISDFSKGNKTQSVTIEQLYDYFNNSVVPNELYERTVTFTPTQILSLNGGGSIELIAAPGAGKIIVPISYASFLDFNTTPYNVSVNALNLTYKDASLASGERFAWINSIFANADLYVIGSPAIDAGLGIFSVAENQALVLKTNTGVPVTDGDSPLKINILYRIIDFS